MVKCYCQYDHKQTQPQFIVTLDHQIFRLMTFIVRSVSWCFDIIFGEGEQREDESQAGLGQGRAVHT